MTPPPPKHAGPRLAAGFLLVPSAAAMLFWNEGHERAVASALTEGGGAVISASATAADPRNEGKLIHLSGALRVPEPLTDPDFGVTVPDATRLRRQVEMYQWRETGRNRAITQEWADHAIDSRGFREPYLYRNPPMPWTARDQVAPRGDVGAFQVDETLLRQLGPETPLPLDATLAPPAKLPAGAVLSAGLIHTGANPAAPAIGDSRVRYSVTRADRVSIIGRQTGGTIRPYPTGSGEPVFLIAPGTLPASGMLHQAEADNHALSWALRFLGAGMVFGGTRLAFRPLSLRLPVLAPLTGAAGWLVAALAVLILVPLSIGAGWLAARPVLAGGALICVTVAAVLTARWSRR